jgi:FMN phosphatase YigB (HAD superfamily)
MHYLIFDYDGVLADTWEVGIHALIDQGIVNTYEEGRKHRLKHFCGKPIHQRDEGIHNPKRLKEVETISQRMNQFFVNQGYKLFDEFISELEKLEDVTMAIVSSGAKVSILPNTQKMNIAFTHILSIEDGHYKGKKIRRICNDWKVDVKEILYFTDTLSDVFELETFMPKKNIIGCAWGYLGYDVLRQELTDEQILREPKDIHDVISKVKIQKSNDK